MRRTITLVSLLIVAIVAACSDDRQPTSPATTGRGISTPTGTASSRSISPSPNAKPTDQVGFTKITTLIGNPVSVLPSSSETRVLYCPAGSWATGGGHQLQNRTGTHPLVSTSIRAIAGDVTGWSIGVDNTQAGSGSLTLLVWVLCAS